MLSNKSIQRISFLLALLVWLLLLAADLMGLFYTMRRSPGSVPSWLPQMLLATFTLLLFFYFRSSIGKAESVNFTDLLWRVFVTGLLATLASLLLLGVQRAIAGTAIANIILVQYLFYHINVALVIMFLVSTFVVWKRLILYQKTKSLLRFWHGFEYLLLASLILRVAIPQNSPGYSVINFLNFGMLAYALVLSVNLKWVAYLNFRQKWKSILLILLVLLYLSYFTLNMYDATDEWGQIEILNIGGVGRWRFLNLQDSPVVLALLGFTIIYSLFSLLVILFNLPTSSVFEQKLEEVINFQRLSQAIQAGEKEEHVYNILLDSAVSAVVADAAWLEIHDMDGEGDLILQRTITDEELLRVKKSISKGIVQSVLDGGRSKAVTSHKLVATLKDPTYRSMSVYPLLVQNKQIGTLVLLKEVADGFNKEMVDIINTFVNQASVSIENFRLLSEALENERYKEELKIAQRVQQALLPKQLASNDSFSIHAFSIAADEVGGDYYDTYQISDHEYAVIIGDVSGKGTSAAFNMSQMKGVFHSLVRVTHDPKEFMVHANSALSRCLEKTSFITISYFIINTETKTITFARAGHCPTLYFDETTGKAEFFQNKGLGLGILRNKSFEKHVQVNTIEYKPNDVMLLYTDGITEANNTDGEEFGYDRLRDLLELHAKESPEKIQEQMIESVYNFSGNRFLNDDYSMVVVKFNAN